MFLSIAFISTTAVIHALTSKQIKNPLSTYHNDGRGHIYPHIQNAGWLSQRLFVIVQALASQGDVIALFHALDSTWTVYLLIVSPLFRGSNPYPCGSLTYRNGFHYIYSICFWFWFVKRFRLCNLWHTRLWQNIRSGKLYKPCICKVFLMKKIVFIDILL